MQIPVSRSKCVREVIVVKLLVIYLYWLAIIASFLKFLGVLLFTTRIHQEMI